MMSLPRQLEEILWKSYMREKRKVFWETSAWHVRSILRSLFSRASAEISRPFHREFTTVVCWKPLLEPCSQAIDRFCSPFRSSAHVSGQKLLTFRVIYHVYSDVLVRSGKWREGSTEFTPMIELCAQGSINPEATRVEPLLEQDLRCERWKSVLRLFFWKMSCCMKRSRTLEMVSNIQRKKFALNVRRDGPQPSILVRSFRSFTNCSISWIH